MLVDKFALVVENKLKEGGTTMKVVLEFPDEMTDISLMLKKEVHAIMSGALREQLENNNIN